MFVLVTLLIVGIFLFLYQTNMCPMVLRRKSDGTLVVEYENGSEGRTFRDMNEYEQWWNDTKNFKGCKLPILKTEKNVIRDENYYGNEQTYAKTPINKVDDYEFSRIFGYERNGHMEIPRQNFDMILNTRVWPDNPSDDLHKRVGLKEGFSASGEYNNEDYGKEATQRFGEHRNGNGNGNVIDDDVDCHMSRKSKEVAELVALTYKNDKDYEPVITRIGSNNWEVSELKPRRRNSLSKDTGTDKEDNRVVDTDNDTVDVQFKFNSTVDNENEIDPYFPNENTPWYIEKNYEMNPGDNYSGPIPGMDRMFGPTFDRKSWIVGEGR